MKEFTIKLAGKTIRISAQNESTEDFCRDYLVQGEADFSISVTNADIDFEREKSKKEALLEGNPVQDFSDSYLETLAVYRKITAEMLKQDTILFHGSAIAVDGEGYLFTAKSGTGKSTHTRLWRQLFGSRAYMVNDDKPLLAIRDDGVWVCGTPWAGKHNLNTNVMVKLKGICILERGKDNVIAPVSAKEALPQLLQQCQRSANPAEMLMLLNQMDKLLKFVPIFRLRCNMDPEAARVAYEGMQPKE